MIIVQPSYRMLVPPGPRIFDLSNPTPDADYTDTFIVPSGITTLYVTVVAGGGGGGGNADACTGGGGGGSGGYQESIPVAVTPGQSIVYTIGKRGIGGGYIFAGTAGGTTTFSGVSATGGQPGATGSATGGAAGSPNGLPGSGRTGGSCGSYGTGGYPTGSSSYVLPTGNGAGGPGPLGCYSSTFGGNRGGPGTPGRIIITW